MSALHRGEQLRRPRALALLTALTGLACQPVDEHPGLWLAGDTVREEVSDWSFSDPIEEIFIETRPWYRLPHSTTIWCVALDGGLYVGSYGDEKKAWERNVERNPEARLSIAGRLYEVTLEPVTDGDLIEAIDTAYSRKYDMVEVFGDEVPDWWYYRVAQHTGSSP